MGGIWSFNVSGVLFPAVRERDMLSSGIGNSSTKCKLFGQLLTPKEKRRFAFMPLYV